MIYTTKGFKQQRYNNPNGDEWTHFTNSIVNHAVYNGDDFNGYKANQAPYAVYGENKNNELARGQSELLTRSILFIDIDNGNSTYEKTHDRMANILDGFNVTYAIYPTIRHGVEQGERLRLGIALDKALNQADYIKLWLVLVVGMNLIADFAGVTKSFKQLQGLYVKTTNNEHIEPTMTLNLPLDTALFLNVYNKEPDKYERYTQETTSSSRERPKQRSQDGNVPVWAINNQLRFNALQDPERYYMEYGGWDNMLTHLGGWVFNQTHGDVIATANIIDHVNSLGSDPIPDKVLADKFKNWAQKWSY